MSNFVRKLKPFVSYEALEVACHALESYRQRLKDTNEFEKLKVKPFLWLPFNLAN
jgi:hypothetical protein